MAGDHFAPFQSAKAMMEAVEQYQYQVINSSMKTVVIELEQENEVREIGF